MRAKALAAGAIVLAAIAAVTNILAFLGDMMLLAGTCGMFLYALRIKDRQIERLKAELAGGQSVPPPPIVTQAPRIVGLPRGRAR